MTDQIQDIYYDLYDAQLNRNWELADELLKDIVYLEKQEKRLRKVTHAKEYIGEIYI